MIHITPCRTTRGMEEYLPQFHDGYCTMQTDRSGAGGIITMEQQQQQQQPQAGTCLASDTHTCQRKLSDTPITAPGLEYMIQPVRSTTTSAL